jgi:hypothetical protein
VSASPNLQTREGRIQWCVENIHRLPLVGILSDLEHIAALEQERADNNAGYLSQMREIAALKAERDALVASLNEALEYFEDREDVRDGPSGEQLPNAEMSMAESIRKVLARVKS